MARFSGGEYDNAAKPSKKIVFDCPLDNPAILEGLQGISENGEASCNVGGKLMKKMPTNGTFVRLSLSMYNLNVYLFVILKM